VPKPKRDLEKIIRLRGLLRSFTD